MAIEVLKVVLEIGTSNLMAISSPGVPAKKAKKKGFSWD
jgi:hypothetical protein